MRTLTNSRQDRPIGRIPEKITAILAQYDLDILPRSQIHESSWGWLIKLELTTFCRNYVIHEKLVAVGADPWIQELLTDSETS